MTTRDEVLAALDGWAATIGQAAANAQLGTDSTLIGALTGQRDTALAGQAQAQQALLVDSVLIKAQSDTIAALQARLDVYEPPAPPPPHVDKLAPLGLAVPGGDPAGYALARGAGLAFGVVRLYATQIPLTLATWPDAAAQAALGMRLWLSIAVPVADLTPVVPGQPAKLDAKLAAFVRSLPPGTILTTNHEPSQRDKGITAAAYQAAWNHAAQVITDASAGGVLPAPIDVQANVVKGKYLDGLDPALVKVVGLDGYDGIDGAASATKSLGQVMGASWAYTAKLFPDAQLAVAEFGSSRATGWAEWVVDALRWCKDSNALVACLFTSKDVWMKSEADLGSLADAAELAEAAALIATVNSGG